MKNCDGLFEPECLGWLADGYEMGGSYYDDICDEQGGGIYEQEIEPVELDRYGIYVIGFGIKAHDVGVVLKGGENECHDVAYDYSFYYHLESEVDKYAAY